ncbi:Interleukin-22 receptor subunit alpha-1 [Galemys pyrenaicus]|uniref:Interleukin-22 receptor subunit alpha-1 n=1 Tax=Galemys pyrenaicus TaxID=202257 RepID=A0A8J6DEG1_GALPY|nr:Interleukin-22 receptor subunit alpha-1 [Galemys pyrenaicus]
MPGCTCAVGAPELDTGLNGRRHEDARNKQDRPTGLMSSSSRKQPRGSQVEPPAKAPKLPSLPLRWPGGQKRTRRVPHEAAPDHPGRSVPDRKWGAGSSNPSTHLLILLPLSAAHIPEENSTILHNVKFQSKNFENILIWDTELQTAPDVVYSVEYKKYGEKDWLAKEDCQEITHKSCNLTMETANINESYYARVNATSVGRQLASQMTARFYPLYCTTIKAPDVTCIPKVRSIQMIVHPTSTPIKAENGSWLTLEKIFPGLSYRIKLHENNTFRMLEGKEREYEFVGLTPDTEFNGTTTIQLEDRLKESESSMCTVKTLPDQTWIYYSFSGAVLFLMGLLIVGLGCLSYRYVTKPPSPPNSLNFSHTLTFHPLQLMQREHMLIPVFEARRPSSVAETVQYCQVVVSTPRESPGAPLLHGLSGVTYLGQRDIIHQPSRAPPQQTLPPLSYAPQVTAEIKPRSYALQVTPKAKPLCYAPEAIPEAQSCSLTPHDNQRSWPTSYGVCVEDAGKDAPPVTPPSPNHLKPKDQLQKEALHGNSGPGGRFSLQVVTSLATEEPQETKCFHQHLGIHTDPNVPHRRDPGTPGHLTGQLPLLLSIQLDGHSVPLPVDMPFLPCPTTDQGPGPWSLLESLVCPSDEGPVSETEATNPDTQASDREQPAEVDSLFRGLDLTVQWES